MKPYFQHTAIWAVAALLFSSCQFQCEMNASGNHSFRHDTAGATGDGSKKSSKAIVSPQLLTERKKNAPPPQDIPRITVPVAAAPPEGMVKIKDAVPPFFIDQRAVSGLEFSACVDAGVCKRPSYDQYNRQPDYANEPAMSVNYFGATAYCQWKGKRLPTLAEYQAAWPRLRFNGCCARGVLPREWTSNTAGDAITNVDKGIQIRLSGPKDQHSLTTRTTKRRIGVDSSTVRCAMDAPK